MSSRRGALIVLEGCDRVGKSTQCKRLADGLTAAGHKIKLMKFPDRSTIIGKQIDDYLQRQVELPDAAIHLLFAANRWEMVPEIKQSLASGTTLVVDRYAFSGVAYTAAKQVASLSWCKGPDVGLPAPDAVFYLKLSPEAAQKRAVYGSERYEHVPFQQLVQAQFEQLKTEDWCVLDAANDIETIHKEILQHALQVIDSNKFQPLGKLWTEHNTA